jgi:hypothetical protein
MTAPRTYRIPEPHPDTRAVSTSTGAMFARVGTDEDGTIWARVSRETGAVYGVTLRWEELFTVGYTSTLTDTTDEYDRLAAHYKATR